LLKVYIVYIDDGFPYTYNIKGLIGKLENRLSISIPEKNIILLMNFLCITQEQLIQAIKTKLDLNLQKKI
jgi:hypothetical protein